MTLDTLQKLKDAMAVAHVIDFEKTGGAPGGATRFHALFRHSSIPPAPTSLPPAVAGAALTRASSGAPGIPTLAAGKKFVLGRAELVGEIDNVGHVFLYDRLVQTGGLSGIVTTAQTVNSVALPARAGGGDGVELWAEIYTAIGATNTVMTASYTNQAGTAGRTATSNIGSSSNAPGQSGMFGLQAGDTGVRSVQSVTLTATTGTAGNFGIVLRKRIADLTLSQGRYEIRDIDWIGLALPPVDQDACIEAITLNSNNNQHSLLGKLYLAPVDV